MAMNPMTLGALGKKFLFGQIVRFYQGTAQSLGYPDQFLNQNY